MARKETIAANEYRITVVIPKLNGFFKKEFGPRSDVTRVRLGDLTLIPVGSNAIELSAPDRKTVDEFLEGFQGEDSHINPTRQVYHAQIRLA